MGAFDEGLGEFVEGVPVGEGEGSGVVEFVLGLLAFYCLMPALGLL
ncbi:hypothetical protein ACFVFS_38495 [Kitasatospora sp. NPDC057692]